MSMFTRARATARNLAGHREVEAELDEELATYTELLVAEKIKAGIAPDEARRLTVAGGFVYVQSGYSHHGGIIPGNVLLAFAPQ